MSCLTGPAGAHPPGRKGSTIMANEDRSIGGIDSHLDTIHVAVIAANGREVDDQEFPTTTSGYRRAVAWLAEHGPLCAVGVEGTSSYGLGICAALTDAGIKVVEVNRTRPAERRRQGKARQDRPAGRLPGGPVCAVWGGHHRPQERLHRAVAGVAGRSPFRGQIAASRRSAA